NIALFCSVRWRRPRESHFVALARRAEVRDWPRNFERRRLRYTGAAARVCKERCSCDQKQFRQTRSHLFRNRVTDAFRRVALQKQTGETPVSLESRIWSCSPTLRSQA